MPTYVYVRGENRSEQRFHKDEDCTQLTKRPARGEGRDLREVTLDELYWATPCRNCYPDAPRASSVHLRCEICNSGAIRPCAHNGGVLVKQLITMRRQTINYEIGDIVVRRKYVWPEHVRHYELA